MTAASRDSHRTSGETSPPSAAPASSAAAPHEASTESLAATRSGAPARVIFPPATLAEFQALAKTGNAGAVHEIHFSNEGLPSCPTPTIDVTVSQSPTGRALQADLAAFFEYNGLSSSRCQAFVYAFNSRGDYLAHQDDGYTAGRVALTNDSGSQRNLEVDTGSVYSPQSQFNFNY